MNLGGGGGSKPRLHHCTPAWATKTKLRIRKKKKRNRKKEGRREERKEGREKKKGLFLSGLD